jgi:hypothetical protein
MSLKLNLDYLVHLVKLVIGLGPYVESEDHRLVRSGSGTWQAGISKVVALACVG